MSGMNHRKKGPHPEEGEIIIKKAMDFGDMHTILCDVTLYTPVAARIFRRELGQFCRFSHILTEKVTKRRYGLVEVARAADEVINLRLLALEGWLEDKLDLSMEQMDAFDVNSLPEFKGPSLEVEQYEFTLQLHKRFINLIEMADQLCIRLTALWMAGFYSKFEFEEKGIEVHRQFRKLTGQLRFLGSMAGRYIRERDNKSIPDDKIRVFSDKMIEEIGLIEKRTKKYMRDSINRNDGVVPKRDRIKQARAEAERKKKEKQKIKDKSKAGKKASSTLKTGKETVVA